MLRWRRERPDINHDELLAQIYIMRLGRMLDTAYDRMCQAEFGNLHLRDGDGLLLTTVKWASGSGKPFLGEDRTRSGIAPSVEVKRAEGQNTGDVDDLTGSDEEKPNQPNTKPVPPEPVAPKSRVLVYAGLHGDGEWRPASLGVRHRRVGLRLSLSLHCRRGRPVRNMT